MWEIILSKQWLNPPQEEITPGDISKQYHWIKLLWLVVKRTFWLIQFSFDPIYYFFYLCIEDIHFIQTRADNINIMLHIAYVCCISIRNLTRINDIWCYFSSNVTSVTKRLTVPLIYYDTGLVFISKFDIHVNYAVNHTLKGQTWQTTRGNRTQTLF